MALYWHQVAPFKELSVHMNPLPPKEPFIIVFNIRMHRCQAVSRRTKLQCKNPKAKLSKSTCRFHGGHGGARTASHKLAVSKSLQKYPDLRESRAVRAVRGERLKELKHLKKLGDALGVFK